jgi:folate-binding protein YgfZ
MKTTQALTLIHCTGIDSLKFLQGQLTCDINIVSDDTLQLGAHCNIKGRVESLFEIFKQADDYYLLIPTSIAEHALALLKKYAVFSKVTLNIVEITGLQLPTELPENFDNWRMQQINRGIPTLFPETLGKFLPHDINLPQLNAVSFNKGCYLGQEIVARMEHLGKPKRHMLAKIIFGKPGEQLDNGDIIVDAIDNKALVVSQR